MLRFIAMKMNLEAEEVRLGIRTVQGLDLAG